MASPAERRSPAMAVVAELALTLTTAAWAFMLLLSIVQIAGGSGEAKEWAFYLGGFGLLLPLSLAAGHQLVARLESDRSLAWIATAPVVSLLAVIALARLFYALNGGSTAGSPLFLAGLVAWLPLTATLVGRAPPLVIADEVERSGPLAAGALAVAVAVLAFAPEWVLRPGNLLAALAVAALATAIYLQLLGRRPSRRWGRALDGLAVAAILLVGNDLGLYDNAFRFFDVTSNLHQNFFLGPTNDVLHGRPMLVDTFSQYGAGLFYVLAGWFSIGNLGYGSMTLLSGVLSAVQVAFAYAIVRVAGGSRPIAALCAVVLIATTYFAGSLPPPTSHPSIGGLRYLLPYVLVAVALLSARGGSRAVALRLAPAAVLGLSAVWSLETFTYCLAAFCGLALWDAATAAATVRQFASSLMRLLAPGAVAVVTAHAIFASLTLALTGSLPDWGGYLDFLAQYDVNGISAQPMQAWSPGIAVCAIYFASLAGLALIAALSRPLVAGEPLPLLALAGVVPLGLSTFTYFIGNSYPDVALLEGAPAYLTIALWLTILERNRASVPAPARVAVVGAAFLAAALIGVFAWPQVKDRGADTPLAMAVPGNRSVRAELGRMWRSEPVDARYDAPTRLLARYVPGDGPALVLAYPEETVGILLQARRVNYLPVAHFLQESLILDRSVPRVRKAIARIRPGALMLAEARAVNDPPGTIPLLRATALEIRRRFHLRFVAGDPSAFMIVKLQPRG